MWNPDGKLPEIKYRPIYSPRTAYNQIRVSDEDLLADMTLNFDRFTINLLKRQFQARNGQITLIQFISIVNQHLKSWQSQLYNRQKRLVRCLTILFKEIDINGNGLLDWEQFTNYIIQKATVLKNLKTKSDEAKSYSRMEIKQKQKINSSISKCIYIEDINRIAIFQEGSHTIKFMNPDNGQFSSKNLVINMKQLIVNISSVKKQKNGKMQIKKKDLVLTTDTRILDMIYIPDQKYKVLMTSTSDGMIRGWIYNNGTWGMAYQPDNEEEVIQHHFNEEIYCLSWDPINQILYCGEHSGKICMWNLKTDTQKFLQSQNDQHNLIVTQIIPMPKLQFIATASMDGKIILWNTINYKIKSIYKEHTRGILTMTFNESLILLFSSGFDHQICIWNPYISTLIHKIQIHNSPIICLRIIESNNQLISIDEQGLVKISDTRKFNTITSFNVVSQDESVKFSPTYLCTIKKPLKIIVVGNGINIFEYDKLYNPLTTDDTPSICCKFIEEHLLFLTPAGNKVKVWNVLNGEISKIFLNITMSDITCFCLDALKKRMIIGTYKGQNNIYNVLNGAKFKQLPRHNGQVTNIISHKIDDMELFFTAGIDGLIYIYKQMQDFYQAPRTIQIKNTTITKMVFCPKTNQLIVGTSSGWIGFYDRQTAKLIGTYNDEYQITGLELTKYQAVLITNIRGKVTYVLLPPLLQRYEEGFSFRHYQYDSSTLQNTNKCSQITICTYNKQDNTLYIADQKFNIICYKIEISEDLYKIKQNNKQSNPNNSNVKMIWQVKAHTQIIKSIELITSQKLIITSSYDKKVKIFSCQDGKYIDSLQQNYQKFKPIPIAYQRINSGDIVSANMQPLFKRRPSIRTSTRYKINLTQSDPFVEYQTIKNVLLNPRSNPDWKLFVEAHKHYLSKNEYYQQIIHQVHNTNCIELVDLNHQKLEILQQIPLVTRKKELDKIIQEKKLMLKLNINLQNNLVNTLNNNLFKTPILKQLNSLQSSKSNIRLTRQQQRIFNTYRKPNVAKNVNKQTERENRQRFIEKMSRSKNVQIIKDDSILKSQQQKKAAKRLNLALIDISSNMTTERSLYKSQRERKLPKIL